MSREEVIKKWQLLLDNYRLLDILFTDKVDSLAPDIELLKETIELLKKDQEQDHE